MIQICSRHTVEDFVRNNCNVEAIISINDVDENPPQELIDLALDNNIEMLVLHFDDVESSLETSKCKLFDEQQAGTILHFVFAKHLNTIVSNKILVIHCHGGVSRSVAVGAALLEIANIDNFWIFDNPSFSPNRFVFDLLLKRSIRSSAVILHGFKSEEINSSKIEEKFAHNLKRWEEFNLGIDF